MSIFDALNPRKALARREKEAGLDGTNEVPKPEAPKVEEPEAGTMKQDQFTKPGDKPKSKTPPAEMLRKHRNDQLKAEADDFESEWTKDEVEPLTDAVRAARKKAMASVSRDADEYTKAYDEEMA